MHGCSDSGWGRVEVRSSAIVERWLVMEYCAAGSLQVPPGLLSRLPNPCPCVNTLQLSSHKSIHHVQPAHVYHSIIRHCACFLIIALLSCMLDIP